MRKISVLISFIIIVSSFEKAHSQTDPTLQALMEINEGQYIGKPLDSIITNLPPGYLSMKIRSGGHYYTASFISILYPNEVWIDLYVDQFTHMSPVDRNRAWNINLMRQEALDRISIYKNTKCYKGCRY